VHELGHVLGFNSDLFPYFRMPDGSSMMDSPFIDPDQGRTSPLRADSVQTFNCRGGPENAQWDTGRRDGSDWIWFRDLVVAADSNHTPKSGIVIVGESILLFDSRLISSKE